MIDFRSASIRALADPTLGANLKNATRTALQKRAAVIAMSETFERSRDRAVIIRDAAIPALTLLLDQFCAAARRNGVTVHVCGDYAEANSRVLSILKGCQAKYAVKSKSMLSEEMGLNHYLEANGVRPVETDLGELIVQLAGEAPSHITAPALHKSRFDVAKLFHEKLGMPYSEDINALTKFARNYLRPLFLGARAGITGANFAMADSGAIAVVENEGNARMCMSLPKTHIAVFGIEKLIPRAADLGCFLDLLSKSATGQLLNAYTSVVSAPRAGGERHFIVVTRGRLAIASDPVFREALRCIRCGACQNVCPVFRRVSGHAYGFAYGGPIGVVLAPFFKGYGECEDLLNASTLCGLCSKICPVKVPLADLIVEHRRRLNEEHPSKLSFSGRLKKAASFAFRVVMDNRLIHKLALPLMRAYFRISSRIAGSGFVPFWHVPGRRRFVAPPRRTFMERYFSKR